MKYIVGFCGFFHLICVIHYISINHALDASISSAVATACLCYAFEKKESLVIKEVKK